jgi:hypothetical protein
MLSTKVVIARPVKVILNTGDRKSVKVLHTGQVPYIRSLARKRYNTQVVG